MDDIEIDSVMVLARTVEARRRLERAGGEVWQLLGQVSDARRSVVKWTGALVKLDYRAAVRLGIVPGTAPAPAVAAQPKASTPAKASTTKPKPRRRKVA